MGVLDNIKGFFLPLQAPDRKAVDKNLSNYISKVQLMRIRQDVSTWRESITEAENAWYPHRVKMQRMYLDTVLNGHVSACMDKRKNLTLLKDFCLVNQEGEEIEENPLKIQWFYDFMNYCLDAQFYGYSLISLGDLTKGSFNDLSTIRRADISPDRLNVTNIVYAIDGANFMEEPYVRWHVYVPTFTENGISKCGYGILLKVAVYEIFCRNLMGFNGDFVEMFAQPYRVGKTTKTDEDERAEFAKVLQDMGSAGWALTDPQDEIEFLETALGGTGYQGYDNLEKRCEAKISKLILGHADAMDSTPGKLGGGQGEENPVYEALEAIQTRDMLVIEAIVNGQLIPRMQKLGLKIPGTFKFKNNAEKEEFRTKEDASNKVTAEIAQIMSTAGLQMDAKYFEERTGIPTKEAPQPAVAPAFSKEVKNKLENLYK